MREFLLDTHTLLWWQTGSPRLSYHLNDLIINLNYRCWVSAASWWEVAIKISIGRLPEAVPLQALIQDARQAGLQHLPIEPRHILRLSQLPFPANGHRDPFDRLLIAQALTDDLTLPSSDGKFDAYSIRRDF
ncbi:PilT protein domain protein [Hymenobacter roseosalivarius DSM 11622]|uniref:PilT protein domain protein n=1 Tax=Hymenobacter roseosalivarius DSM 11622 TaxID=645990 RepID=A0A1W1W1N9_9BACT|nr:type II toxin-antitoxin system VapC family toxin [Hymenobacter roseosalivarius]SMB99291.1 PilT protein domain protein [Hymenobacter roseosalivarius DSM 11622]